MSEELNNQGTTEEGKEEKIMKEALGMRTRRKIGQLWIGYRKYLAMALMGVMGFLVGMNYWAIRSATRFITMVSHSSESSKHPRAPRSSTISGCELYPNEPVCKAARQPGREDLDAESCFVPKGSKLGKNDLFVLPDECSNFGPLGGELVNLTTLRDETSPLKLVTEVPSGIKPYFERANAQLSVKSALITFIVAMRANGEEGKELVEELMKESSLIPIIQELSLASDDGLTEEERKTAGQMLSIYNAFVSVLQGQQKEQREKIAKECAGFADKDIIPIRCVAINSPSDSAPTKPL